MRKRPQRAIMGLCALAAGGAFGSWCPAQTPVPAVVDPSSVVRYRLTMLGREGQWYTAPSNIALDAAISEGAQPSISLRGLTLSQLAVSCDCPVMPASSLTVAFTGVQAIAAPNGVTLPCSAGADGSLEFSGANIAFRASGTANYTTVGAPCNTLINGGGTCSGPYDLGLVPASQSGLISAGLAAASGTPRRFSMAFYGTSSFTTNGSWGRLDVLAQITASVAAGTPTCAADFDQSGGLSVQDIFTFLNAWFAGDIQADFNHVGGLSIQDIFDFLNAWFVGCP